MDYMAIAGKAAKEIKKLLERDRDHRIVVNEDYVAGRFSETVLGHSVPDYDCDYFTIKDRVLTIKKTSGTPIIDGATYAPDKIGGVDMAVGYIPHDLGYSQLDMMAANVAWREAGWTAAEIRHLWDIVLGNAIRKNSGLWARVYYTAARWFGGLFGAILAALILAGCGGCAVPNGFEPGDIPDYTVVPVANSAD